MPPRASPAPTPQSPRLRHRIEDLASAALIGLFRLLPYPARVRAFGAFSRTVLGPLAMNRRIRRNLAHVWPDLPPDQVRRLCHEVADNFGRSFIELHSPRTLSARSAPLPILGPGLAAIEAARDSGRPVILATAHYGNYDAWRSALIARGFPVGALYMPMKNPAANRRYVATISQIGTPLFPRSGEGMADMIRFLRAGGMLGIVTDHYMPNGEVMDFLGKPAWTATSTAKMAVKYDALLVPIYATRNADGLSFTIETEAPIPHGDPLTMTRALNASVEARIRARPGQWFWLHRRWKGLDGTPPAR